MPLPVDIFKSSLLRWVNTLQGNTHPWTDFLRLDTNKIGGLNCLQRNTRRLPRTITSPFNIALFKCFQETTNLAPVCPISIIHTSLWENPSFKNERRKKLPFGRLAKAGFCTPWHFCDRDGNLVQTQEARGRGLPMHLDREWSAAVRSIENRLTLPIPRSGYIRGQIIANTFDANNQPLLLGKEGLLPHSDFNGANLCRFIAINRKVEPGKLQKDFADWAGATNQALEESRELVQPLSICTRMRAFHVRLTSGLLYGNHHFFKFGHRPSPGCNWCAHIDQTPEHLLKTCPKVISLRQELAQKYPKLRQLSSDNWVLGVGLGNSALTFITLMLNYFIYQANFHYTELSVNRFLDDLNTREKLERNIAKTKLKSGKHRAKWVEINQLFH